MHRVASARWLNRALRIGDLPASNSVPLFLCPSLAATNHGLGARLLRAGRPSVDTFPSRSRQFHADALGTSVDPVDSPLPAQEPEKSPDRKLPSNCSGCGAYSQTTDPDQFGYFCLQSKRVKSWLDPREPRSEVQAIKEADVVAKALESLDVGKLEALGLDPASLLATEAPAPQTGKLTHLFIPLYLHFGVVYKMEIDSDLSLASSDQEPVCDRCHDLTHHGATSSITMHHPTVESLRETIEESPYKYNHIYHVIDAADFPMSLIPRLHVLLGDIPLRTRNRRSRSGKYMHDRQIEMSFIITRGDLLGPTKEKVDALMPYLREVLREALGRVGGRIRLGNLRCVSAKRGWWTKPVKEDIWRRGGAGWMIGKVNVGKSQLFEAVYPKGRMIDMEKTREVQMSMYPRDLATEEAEGKDEEWEDLDEAGLLPPAQPLRQYPPMPMVSALPGTTASPIRIPFGNGKGELIDLPGLARSDLELFVKPEHRQSLVMKSRIVPEQISVQPSKSLILGGGLIRITPRDSRVNFLMYNFTPLEEHLTSAAKAEEFQLQSRESSGVESIALDGTGEKMKHAGTFQLQHDVTKSRAGPLTRKNAVGMKVDNLPFRVLSVDILIEGVGYVEIVAQVRAKSLKLSERPVARNPVAAREKSSDPFADMMHQRRDANSRPAPEQEMVLEPVWPEVDVYSPEGRFVGSRRPLQGWLNNKPLVKPEHLRSRPRKSMKGQKKNAKMEKRAAGDGA